jgi:signal transduction histidine kinase
VWPKVWSANSIPEATLPREHAAAERPPGPSPYQRLVDRWVDLTAWPTAKKTVVVMAYTVVLWSVIGVCVVLALTLSPGLVDLPRLARVLAIGVVAIGAVVVLAVPAALRGQEGRWTVYAMIVVLGSYLAWLISLLGLANTPWFAIVPLVVLVVPIFWDPAAGRFAFAFVHLAMAVILFFELTGRIPFAPLMQQRTLDAQRTLGWYLATYAIVFAVLAYVFLLVQLSVSVRERQQRRLEAARRELEAASRHKSEFLANMSHELRTPLNAVIGFSEVLQARIFGALNDKQAEYVDDILHSGRHLLSLINDILDLSKIEAGRVELEPSTFDLTGAIDNAMLLVKERAVRRGLRLDRRLPPDLGTIHADERKLKQVLANLLSNAVKFTPEGGTIRLSATRGPEAVTLAVEDTGVGIDPKDQALIFEEFRQVGNDYTRKQEGTGLGLTLARRFVELHGGRLWVESTPGRGSTFSFTLPLGPPGASQQVAVGQS